MAKKRGNNEGTIHRRKSGSWRAQVTLDGHRLGFTADTRKECQDWIRETLGKIDDGLTFANTKLFAKDFLNDWLTSKKASIRPTTYTHYELLIRKHAVPHIGNIKLKDLRPQHIQRLYNLLPAKGVGIPTIEKLHTALHSAFSYAAKTGIITRNPANATIPPSAPPKEMQILTENQVSQMFITAKGHRWEALYYLAVTSGMRQMELLGLKWTDLDWMRRTIKIERQLVRPNAENRVEFTSPKTKFGRRTIDLGSNSMEMLRKHYDRQLGEHKKAGEKWKEYGLIFTNSFGGPIHYRNLLRNYKALLRDAGLPKIRFHDLRHTAASLMLNHNVPVIVVSRRLGHARPSITLDIYGHLIPSMQTAAAQLIDELVTPIELQNVAPGCTRLHPVAPERG